LTPHVTYSRAYLQFDLERAAEDPRTFAVFWGVLRRAMFRASAGGPAPIERVLETSARHGAAVSRALRVGVIEAVGLLLSGLLASKKRALSADRLAAGFDESLTLVYRVLFLLFAEARGLVPNWHPVYRDGYTIESLRDLLERPDGQSGDGVRGLWETLQAIARLAHKGCHAGTLVVPAFNGRLFSPAHTPMAERCTMSDQIAREALLALSTAPSVGKRGRARIDYRDLGVEQLGAVYESVLDYEPALAEPLSKARRGPCCGVEAIGGKPPAPSTRLNQSRIIWCGARSTRWWLAPSAPQILNLRVVDPSMGSAAFLVAACHYLAGAYERALVRDGDFHPGEIDEAARAGFRRQIAQRCLYGVDLNPTAVQLARLSLWLAHACGRQAADISRSPLDRWRQSSRRLAAGRGAASAARTIRIARGIRETCRCLTPPISSRRSRPLWPSGDGSPTHQTKRWTWCARKNGASTRSGSTIDGKRWRTSGAHAGCGRTLPAPRTPPSSPRSQTPLCAVRPGFRSTPPSGCWHGPAPSPRRAASFTGCSNFLSCISAATASRNPIRVSTP
jgi:hypothetical protein